MKKIVANSIFFLLFVLCTEFMTAQETRTCDILNQTLSQNGIPHSIQYLSNSNADEFPYSLIVRLFSENKGAFRRNLFIIVPQSTAIKMQDEIISFCKRKCA